MSIETNQDVAGQNKDHGQNMKKAKKGKMKAKGKKAHMGMKKGKMKGRMMKGRMNDLQEGVRGKHVHKNPVKYMRSVGHNIVTSLTEQTTTTLTVATSPHNDNSTDFLIVIAFLAYKSSNSGTTSCADSLGNTYVKLSEVPFNSGYVLTLFATSGVNALAKNAIVTVTHAASARRVIMGDEFKNVEKDTPADKTAAAYNSVAAVFATSGMTATTSQDKELLYGVIGVNGPSTDSFKRPQNWTILHDRGTNAGDSNDIRLVSLFRLTGTDGTYEVSGTLGVARLWGSITQTFKAQGGASDISKD
jgi:hypothetical protein